MFSFFGFRLTVLDQVTLGEGLVIQIQSIGVANKAKGFDDGVDGLLGISQTGRNANTIDNVVASVNTPVDNLKEQGIIKHALVAISFSPSDQPSVLNGEMNFGVTDPSKFTGEITYTPVTSRQPSSEFWGIDQTVTYGKNSTPLLVDQAGIVDTGTTLLTLGTDAFKQYQKLVGATLDDVCLDAVIGFL